MITLGLCAPLTIKEKIAFQLIATSCDPRFKYPWGSHILIDEKVSWANIRIIHDAHGLTKLDRIAGLSKILRNRKLPIRVCSSQFERLNCGICNKCLLTIAYLIISGKDPNSVELNINKDFLQSLRKYIIKLNERKLFKKDIVYWNYLKNNFELEKLDHNLYGCKDFLNWLKTYEINKPNKKIDDMLVTFYYKIYCRLPEKTRKILSIAKKISITQLPRN
jgi:hypothetical protein